MKKKIIGFVVLALSAVFLVACSNKLDGKYYWINEYTSELQMTISGTGGSIKVDGREVAITDVDSKNEQVTFATPSGDYTFNLKYNDGKVTTPENHDLYKKGTKAFDEAMKKYGYTEKDLEE